MDIGTRGELLVRRTGIRRGLFNLGSFCEYTSGGSGGGGGRQGAAAGQEGQASGGYDAFRSHSITALTGASGAYPALSGPGTKSTQILDGSLLEATSM